MAIEIRTGVDPLRSLAEIDQKVKYHHEQEFARFLLPNKKIEVIYEPVKFVPENGNGNGRHHLPDFAIRNLRTGKVTYIEITTTPKIEFELPVEEVKMDNLTPMGTYQPIGERIDVNGNGWVQFNHDPKSRAKLIVQKVGEELGENIPYIVLYRQQLERIQRHNPQFNFFSKDRNSPSKETAVLDDLFSKK